MKRKAAPRNPKRSIEVKVGNTVIKIYRSLTRGRELFTVAYRGLDHQRVKRSFADLHAAKLEAQLIATTIHNGELDVLKLTNADRSAYGRAVELLQPFRCPIDMAAQEYAQAAGVLAGTATLVEAAKFYIKHHPTRLRERSVTDLVEEMLSAKQVDGMSARYIDDLENRLGRFADKFGAGGIADLTTAEMQQWLNGLGLAHRGRNNFRATIVLLFNFAKSRGFLPKNQPTEADALSKAKGAESPIGIFTPADISKLLANADDSLVPYLAIGAFAGLRTAEIQRLQWSEVKLQQGYIEVAANKSKTAQRRLVPISPNLASWLLPYTGSNGVVCKLSTINQKASDFARRLNVEWPHNGLRHSYASYRLAQCKIAGEVALEMGNSPQMIFRHYRELVTVADAGKWWNSFPSKQGNVVPIHAARPS